MSNYFQSLLGMSLSKLFIMLPFHWLFLSQSSHLCAIILFLPGHFVCVQAALTDDPMLCSSLECLGLWGGLFCFVSYKVLGKWFFIQVLCCFSASCICDVIRKACFSWLAEVGEVWHGGLYCLSTQGQAKAVSGFGREYCWLQQGDYLIWNIMCEYCL